MLTPYPDVNEHVARLLEQVRHILGAQLLGMLLDGSLANGGFDEDSDIDLVVITRRPVRVEQFEALRSMHDALAELDTRWALQVEGSYLSQNAIRRHDPGDCTHPNIERGAGERLKMTVHGPEWDVHRHILREHGIVVYGTDPKTWIDPVPPERLKQVMVDLMQGWGAGLLRHPERIASRGYQSYIVLSLCRVLYTLALGEVASKPQAAAWARVNAGHPYQACIERAWLGRHNPETAIPADDLEMTLAFLHEVLARCQSPAHD